ncbi:MAG: hypothetical protein ACREDR_26250 [Blastocatellia bacterium]
MARGRLISGSLGSSRRFRKLTQLDSKLGEFCQALFPLIVASSDDFGRLEGDAETIQLKVFPASPRKERDFGRALQLMAEAGLIQLYDVAGDRFLQIIKFEQHQVNLHKRTRSRFPPPPGDCDQFRGLPEVPGIRRNGAQSAPGRPQLPHEENGREWNRKDLNGREGNALPRAHPDTLDSPDPPDYPGLSGRSIPSSPSSLADVTGLPEGLDTGPAVAAYWKTFHQIPSIRTQEAIAIRVTDIDAWEEALAFWDGNSYRPESVGKMLDKHDEILRKRRGDGINGANAGNGNGASKSGLSKPGAPRMGERPVPIPKPPDE